MQLDILKKNNPTLNTTSKGINETNEKGERSNFLEKYTFNLLTS